MFKVIGKVTKKIVFGTAKSAVMFASVFALKKIAGKSIKKIKSISKNNKNLPLKK